MHRLATLGIVLACTSHLALAENRHDTCKPAAPDEKLASAFDPGTSLGELAAWVSGFSCKNVVFSDDTAQRARKLTVIVPAALTPRQAEQLFADAIEAAGLVIVRRANTMLIKPGVEPSPARVGQERDIDAAPDAPAADEFDAETKQLIHEVDTDLRMKDATHYIMSGSLLGNLIASSTWVISQATFTPALRKGQPAGFTLTGIKPRSLAARLGLHNGDVLRTLNGLPIDTDDEQITAATQTIIDDTITLAIERAGKPLTIAIDVVSLH